MPHQLVLESEKLVGKGQQKNVAENQPPRPTRGMTLLGAMIRFTFWAVLFGSTCFLVIRGVAAAKNPTSYSEHNGRQALNWPLFCANLLRFDSDEQFDDGIQRLNGRSMKNSPPRRGQRHTHETTGKGGAPGS